MDQAVRNKLRNVVTQCRKMLEESVAQTLQGQFGIYATGKKAEVHVDEESRMGHLSEEDKAYRRDILDHFEHIKARDFKPRVALDQLVREIAFTHLNRLCAYKMMEARGLIRESVSRGIKSQGFLFYLADHPEDEQRYNTGEQELAYRHFLDWLGGTLSEEIGVLFSPTDPANRLYPPQRVLDDVIGLLNGEDIKPDDAELRDIWPSIWSQDETIGWVYQYFTPKELRDEARSGNKPPANSYELAFRNQFFTPRYVVEFLTDNTLGRIWYEMRKGRTKLVEQCHYLVHPPGEIFLHQGEIPPDTPITQCNHSEEESLSKPINIPHRPKKDPRELKILDPACGSGHFLLYCFDLLLTIYEEAYDDAEVGAKLRQDYPNIADLRRDVPRLILARNLHGIDIDLRCTQIAALALWLRCQRAYQTMGLMKERPSITRSNVVCAEPMPGEEQMVKEFVSELEPKLLGQIVEVIFEKMKLAGETGSLLKIEVEIREAVAAAKSQFVRETTHATDKAGRTLLFTQAEMERVAGSSEHSSLFDLTDLTDEDFFDQAEARVVDALGMYAEKANAAEQLQRQLFADDARRGFSFIDLCRSKYDIVLMNPPFGAEVPSARSYITSAFPTGKHDLCASFIYRFLDLLTAEGRLGAITTRTALFVQSFSQWRNDIMDARQFTTVADLGYGVLDAMVETAMYVIANSSPSESTRTAFISALTATDKQQAIVSPLGSQMIYLRSQSAFQHISGQPMAYWVPDALLSAFREFPSFLNRGGGIKVGVQTGEDFRFYRLAWEVRPGEINRSPAEYDREFASHSWMRIAKGGEYSPWWDDIHLLMYWKHDGADIRSHPSAYPKNLSSYFKPGLTYPYRTTSGFALRCLPYGCGFSAGGWAVLPPSGYSYHDVLALYNSRPARYFMEVLLGLGDSSVAGSAARNHVTDAVGGVPWPHSGLSEDTRLLVDEMIETWRTLVSDETCVGFSRPTVSAQPERPFEEAIKQTWQQRCDGYIRIAEISHALDDASMKAFQIDEANATAIDEEEGRHPCSYPVRQLDSDKVVRAYKIAVPELISMVQKEAGSKRYVVKKAYFIDRQIDLLCHLFKAHPLAVIRELRTLEAEAIPFREFASQEWMSLSVGTIYGRWDAQILLSESESPSLPAPLETLPACSPLSLVGSDGLPVEATGEGYSVEVRWDGILIDDPEHSDDIVRQTRSFLERAWGENSDGLEADLCRQLRIKQLRDYFRKPGKGGFWDDHVKRYSKSRRKAPIYWLLQSSKKNYALWLYYHRFDKDMLLKALVNYVEPKLRLEENRLDSLRSQKTSSEGVNKKLDKQIEKQEDLLSEIQDFEARLRRVADLHLEPDLNDGVVLNIAPLHELVPWREAKKYWDALMKGEYEWSSIGQQLREKGLVE